MINFLDFGISIENGRYEVRILPPTIHGSSFCSNSHMFAAFNGMTHRLVNIPLSLQNCWREVATIKQLVSPNNTDINTDRLTKSNLEDSIST
mgnify:CR=1 FL=1